MTSLPAKLLVALVSVILVLGCVPGGSASSISPTGKSAEPPTAEGSPEPTVSGSLVIAGRIITMDEPNIAEAMLIQDGTVAAVGTVDQVRALAVDDVPVIDIGQNVAYPGFIDAHAHWIGDREYYGIDSPAAAMDAAISRGWTSISEQWVDKGRLRELDTLAAADALPLRVDAYLALNGLGVGDYYGDWYADRQPGAADDHLRVQGLKIHLDSGSGATIYWEADDLVATIGRANAAGWQVSVHAVSTQATEMVIDAFEAAIGPIGPNPLHHRIEHALQVTDDQLARMVAMDLTTVIQLDGAGWEWVRWAASEGEAGRDYEREDVGWLARWRDFVDAGLHVAATSDAPWFLVDFTLTKDIGRPVDQIASGMDGRGRVFQETPTWALDQLLTADQGLRAVTVDAAHALGDETRRGHLAAGTLGDVTILSGDVTSATPDEIRAMTIVATIVNGIVVYCSAAEVCGAD
ncbi:MAG: amidohydrolase family protein [Candidatus Limnocylindrales bacterium]